MTAQARLTPASARWETRAGVQLPDFTKLEDVQPLAELGEPLVLSEFEQRQIVERARELITGYYVHRPLKRATRGVDADAQLAVLLERLAAPTSVPGAPGLSQRQFHGELAGIFAALDDLHTVYVAPGPYAQLVAFLPFLVEEYWEPPARRYLLTKLDPRLELGLEDAVDVVALDGVPIERAVELSAQASGGANAEARHARGLDRLTKRWLGKAPPPDRTEVVVRYVGADGAEHDSQPVPWLVGRLVDLDAPVTAQPELGVGLDAEGEMRRRTRARVHAFRDAPAPSWLDDKLAHERLPPRTDGRRFGLLRIRAFPTAREPREPFLEDVDRRIAELGDDGLIIDLRGNTGGDIETAERLLRRLAGRETETEPLQFLATPATSEVARRLEGNHPEMAGVRASIDEAVRIGGAFARGTTVADVGTWPTPGQRYPGPILAVVDALCYSATEIFAAGLVDNEVGELLGTSPCTGGGGANSWKHEVLFGVLGQAELQALPKGTLTVGEDAAELARRPPASFRLAMRRTTRVRERAGSVVEEFGVAPRFVHALTRRDLLERNPDLIEAASRRLETMDRQIS